MRGAHEKETDVSLAQRVVWLSHWKKSGRVHRIVKFKFKMEFEPPPREGCEVLRWACLYVYLFLKSNMSKLHEIVFTCYLWV